MLTLFFIVHEVKLNKKMNLQRNTMYVVTGRQAGTEGVAVKLTSEDQGYQRFPIVAPPSISTRFTPNISVVPQNVYSSQFIVASSPLANKFCSRLPLCVLVNREPVSYTHLDVYKRQP